jgi:hypothetical protein
MFTLNSTCKEIIHHFIAAWGKWPRDGRITTHFRAFTGALFFTG